ncbi:g5372 [Coccomyxa viridis]|uniref:G5372 protein n=1 Tax=Coccomyxa viridis TaxID=1274662 RepID=A0ABP1FXT8_9CHLO
MVASLGVGISFSVNGKKHTLDPGLQPCTTLYDFLRGRTTYTGTKSGCGEGGCGSCSVEVYQYNPSSGSTTTKCINACLAPIASLDGCSIVTVEGLGNCSSGFNPVQDAIARHHGSQCGYCTPGMVVACHAALSKHEDKNTSPSEEQMEKALDGNLCRCTGYRPILDACKSFVKDVEDLGLHDSTTDRCRVSAKTSLPDDIKMPSWLKAYNKNKAAAGTIKQISGAGQTWAVPNTLAQLMDVLKAPSKASGKEQLRIIAGNTGSGVFKNWPNSDASLVDVTRVEEMRVLKQTDEGGLLIGSAVTQEELIDKLLELTSESSSKLATTSEVASSFMGGFSRLWGGAPSGAAASSADPKSVWLPIAKHLQRIAGNQVRAAATLGGNLVLTRDLGLESDAATLLIAAGAEVQTAAPGSRLSWQSVESYVSSPSKVDQVEVVVAIRLPPIKAGDRFWSFKIAERHWNAHAFINIAALLNIDSTADKESCGVIKSANIILGYPSMHEGTEHKWRVEHAAAVEKALRGAPASLASVVAAVRAVASDVKPGKMPDADFLTATAEGLVFEALVHTMDLEGAKGSKKLPECVLEVPSLHEVELSHGKQDLPDFTRPGSAAGEPIMKERALLQASGEAMYTYDMPEEREGLYAAFVGSTEALAVIKGIDASEALSMPGVLAVLDARDVPGENKSDVEEVFASKKVQWVGQPIALVVAESRAIADRAAGLVKVDYSLELGPPIVTLKDARKQNSFHSVPPLPGTNTNLPNGEKSAVPYVEKCPMQIRGAKWHMPTQVTSSTQSADHVQWAVSTALNLPHNKVNVHCRRAGGGFGGKFSRSRPAATAVAVAAYTLRRQVRLQTNRNQDMRMNGGRAETDVEYDIGFDDTGRIHALEIQAYMLGGAYLGGSTVDMYQLKGNIDQVLSQVVPNPALLMSGSATCTPNHWTSPLQ